MPNITITTSRLLQILLTVMQVANFLLPQVPMKYKPFVTAFVGVLQIFVNDLSHNSNPDGTPAATPYVAPPIAQPPAGPPAHPLG